MSQAKEKPRVVIIGGGFGGLQAAKKLANKPVEVILIDRKNHHTFQPLLYQVATAVLSPGEIASPIRRILHKYKNIEVLLGEVVKINAAEKSVSLENGSKVGFDYLIVAAGSRHSYFGHDEWEDFAPGLKTIEDAVEIRRRILLVFELAERDAIINGNHEELNFVVVGGGPTGVELAGAIADIARQSLASDFKEINTRKARVTLYEGSSRILGTFAEDLSAKAQKQLEELGVEVKLNSIVKEIDAGRVKVGDEWIACNLVLWATGVAASPLGTDLDAETDRAGRVLIHPDLSVPKYKDIFVIGDMVSLKQENGHPVPGVAPAAMQMAETAVKNILGDLQGRARENFKYFDKGNMATIGKSRAILEAGRIKMSGFLAWLAWLFVHILSLIGFRNRLSVMGEWFWAYLTRERSARLITGDAQELESAIQFLLGDANFKIPVNERFNRKKNPLLTRKD